VPIIDIPAAPIKPVIKSEVIKVGDKFYVAYSLDESLRLLDFLYQKDAYEDKLRVRINIMNDIISSKK
jgi:hypothetical protein